MEPVVLSVHNARMRPEALRWRNTLGYYSLFVCIGLGTAILGPTIPDLARQTGTTVARIGAIIFVGSIGYTGGTLLGGRLFDRLRGHALLGVAQIVSAGCLVFFPVTPWFWALLALSCCRGAADGMVNTGGNTLLLWTHGEKASPFMNGLHFCFGLGAVLSPLLVGWLITLPGGYRWAYWAVAAFDAAVGLSVLAMGGSPDPREHTRRAQEAHGRAGGIAYAPIALSAVYLFAYVGAEISFGSWVSTYARELHLATAAGAAFLASAFWLSFTIGRGISVAVAIRFTPRQVIPAALAACLVLSALLMILPPSAALLWAVSIALGFFMAPIWPSGFTLAGQVVAMTAFTSGLVLLGDSFGGMVLPALTGTVMEASGERMSLSLPLLVFGSLTVCLLAFWSLVAVARRRAVTETSAGA
jgi:FHS family Na+ dependent glucose MFS transporter 1